MLPDKENDWGQMDCTLTNNITIFHYERILYICINLIKFSKTHVNLWTF